MSKTIFEVREIDENTYDATVTKTKGEWLRTYGGEKPTVEQVKEDFKNEPKTFRKVGS